MQRTYLDAGGHAPVHPVAREAFLAALDDGWADPGRVHAEGRRARLLLDAARETLAEALGARPEEIHLTPSHTAGLHAAVASATRARRRTSTHVVTSAVERAAVLVPARGVDDSATTVPVDRQGRVLLDAWRDALASPAGVALAALQHANGEVGTLQPLEVAYEAARRVGAPLLVDAGASVGHVPVGPAWDLLAADPADWGGVPGVGVLAVRSRVRTSHLAPDDDDPWAPGGVSIPAAVAAAASLRAVLGDRGPDPRRAMIERLRARVAREVPDVDVLGDATDRLPHVVTFSCLYVDGEALLTELDRRGFAVGSGSACTSSSLEPSHVLAAMGVLTHGNVRIALPRGIDPAAPERFCDALAVAVDQVRRMAGATGL